MTTNDFARISQYDYLYEGVMNAFPALKNLTDTRFQYLATPMSANWSMNSNDIFYGLADATPGEAGGFYTVGSGHISAAYTNLIKGLSSSVGMNDPAYQKLDQQYKMIQKLYDEKLAEARSIFNQQKAQGMADEDTFKDWLEGLGGRVHKQYLDGLYQQSTDYKAARDEIAGAIGAPLADAKAGLDDDKMLLTNNVKVPRTVIGGNLVEDIVRWQPLAANYKSGINVGFELNVTMNKNTHLTTDWSATLEASTKIRPCHPVEIEEKLNIQRILLDEHYSMSLKAIGCNTYPITRGTWYQDTFVRSDMKTYETSTFKISDFFGPKGSLRLIPTMLLVVYHPIIELTVSTKTYKQEISEQLKAYTGPRTFFGLNFDASKAPKVLEKDELTTLTMEAADTQSAQLLGVISVDKATVK